MTRSPSHASPLLLLFFAACASGARGSEVKNPEGLETLVLRFEGTAGRVTFPELASDLGYLDPIKLDCVGNTISGPGNLQNVVTGDVDFGSAFNGAVIKLRLAKAPITAVIGSYGVDDHTWTGYFVLADSPIRDAKDLIGKKVAMNTLGAHHEFMLKEYLFRNGLNAAQAADVTLVVVPPVNTEQALRQRQVEVATLGDILRDKALERGGIRPLFTDRALFGNFTAGSYVMRDDFIRKHPNSVRKFVQATARAIEWARTTPRDVVVARFEAIVARRHRNEDPGPLQYWQSTGIAGEGGRISDKEFQVWIDWLVRDGTIAPGQIDVKELYTNAFQAPGRS